MKLFKMNKTVFTAMAALGSVVVMAGTYNTVMVNSTEFMKDEEIKFVKRFDSSEVRNVASTVKAPVQTNNDVEFVDKIQEIEENIVQPVQAEIVLNDENRETVIDRALFPDKTSEILKGSRVYGELSLTENSIESLSFSLEISETEVIEFNRVAIDLQAGGSFQVDYEGEVISGIVANSGKGGVQVNFATGQYKGLVLTFVTQEQKEELMAKEEEAQRFKEEELAAKEEAVVDHAVNEASEQASYDRQMLAQDEANAHQVEMLSEEQAEDQAAQEGYEW